MVVTILILAKSFSMQSMDSVEVEKRARELGMMYPEEFKVINTKDVKK